ncbi:MAG: hypothetical protein JWN95_136, partial [Frankiales bacterium]|nr:hypothetical protein [Frankiales bacterium]
YGIAMVPDQAPVASLAAVSSVAAGASASFDASASTGTSTAIANYHWDFGDGNTSDTGTTATTTHSYTYAASYTATVTATDTVGTSTTQVFTGQTVLRNGSAVATASRGVTISNTLGFVSVPSGPAFTATLTGPDQHPTAAVPLDITNQALAGWNISLTSTRWNAGSGHVLPIAATAVLSTPTVSCDTTCTAAVTGQTYPYIVPAGTTAPTATKLFSANSNTGMGNQTVHPTFQLTVPAASYAGTYASTWTWTVSSGP